MKKRWKRIISGALAGVMLMTVFAGCSSKEEEKEGIQGSATDMSYNAEGKFTTVVTAEDVSFPEDISAAFPSENAISSVCSSLRVTLSTEAVTSVL